MRPIWSALWRVLTARAPGQVEQAGIDLRRAVARWRDGRERQRRGRDFEREVRSRPGGYYDPRDY